MDAMLGAPSCQQRTLACVRLDGCSGSRAAPHKLVKCLIIGTFTYMFANQQVSLNPTFTTV